MAVRDVCGIALLAGGLVLAPVAMLFGRMWWLAAFVLAMTGAVVCLSSRLSSGAQRSGADRNDIADRGGGIVPDRNPTYHRSGNVPDTYSDSDGD
jgi:hypothetical protein